MSSISCWTSCGNAVVVLGRLVLHNMLGAARIADAAAVYLLTMTASVNPMRGRFSSMRMACCCMAPTATSAAVTTTTTAAFSESTRRAAVGN